MYGYKAFFNGKELELFADSSYQAQIKAAALFKVKKPYQVTIVLCEKHGEQVVHTPTF